MNFSQKWTIFQTPVKMPFNISLKLVFGMATFTLMHKYICKPLAVKRRIGHWQIDPPPLSLALLFFCMAALPHKRTALHHQVISWVLHKIWQVTTDWPTWHYRNPCAGVTSFYLLQCRRRLGLDFGRLCHDQLVLNTYTCIWWNGCNTCTTPASMAWIICGLPINGIILHSRFILKKPS